MKQIPKYQSKGKLPDYYYQTTDTSNGTTYNVHPSAFGAKELTVTTPEVKVTARHPSYQYRSVFDQTAAWEPVHGALELLGKAFNKATDATGTTEMAQKVMPWLMPSQYVGWVRTGNRPGAEGNTGFGEDKMGQYVNEMFDLGVAPAAMKGVGRTVKGVGKGFKHPSEALVGKGVNPAETPLGSRAAIDSGLYPNFSKMTRAEKIQWLKTQQELAQRVDQARNLDALRMTKDRLRNGGFDRLEQSMIDDANNISSDILTSSKTNPPLSQGTEDMIYYNILNNKIKILKAKPTKGTAKEVQIKTKDTETLHPEDAGTGVFDKYFAWFRDAPQKVAGLSKGNKGVAHEFTHYFYFPFRRPKGFDPRVGDFQEYKYYTSPTSQEIVARGTQLKNYFGLKEGEPLTPEMWNYAQRHYAADVANNNMSTFFKAGNNKSPNHPFFLQWLNRNAPVIGGVTTVGTTLLNKNE